MSFIIKAVDVLCVGHASYDLVFSVGHHPEADEKLFADSFIGCGGGPAANAAVMVSKLGFAASFAGYLGHDLYGEKHLQEFLEQGVLTDLIKRGDSPTPLSTILVKPDGQRALINYKGETKALAAGAIDFSTVNPSVILFDGHEPNISVPLAVWAREQGIPTVLDAGSVHVGTSALMALVDYVVASEKFACQLAGNVKNALNQLAESAPVAVITLGEQGLLWKRGQEQGSVPAFSVNAIDTTGAGDAFHGAFAAALAAKMSWSALLNYASAAGSLCCTKVGARLGLPNTKEHQELLGKR